MPKNHTIVSLYEQMDSFREVLNKETDRGVILVAGAWLDEQLKVHLRQFFVDNEKVVDEFFAPARGSFASRIELAYLCGLVREDQYADLNTIRKMRNECAHIHESRSFADQKLIELSNKLRAVDIVLDKFPNMAVKPTSIREKFINSTYFLSLGICIRLMTVEHQSDTIFKVPDDIVAFSLFNVTPPAKP